MTTLPMEKQDDDVMVYKLGIGQVTISKLAGVTQCGLKPGKYLKHSMSLCDIS